MATSVTGLADERQDLAIRATVTAPSGHIEEGSAIVLVCWPGGSYGRGYWDLQIPGRPGYSFAEYMSANGFVVVAADPLGVGESGRPADGSLCTLARMAEAAADFVREVHRRIGKGILVEGLRPITDSKLIGVGHSMGALLAVVEQVLFESYDAVAPLGFPFIAAVREPLDLKENAMSEADKAAAALAHVELIYGDHWTGPDMYGPLDKGSLQAELNGPDAPADIIAFDNNHSVSWSATALIDAFHLGRVERYVQRLQAPSFVAFGELETPGAAKAADHISYYAGVHDLTLFVLPGTYHCHNFQDRRFELWDRLGTWARTVVTSEGFLAPGSQSAATRQTVAPD